MREESGTVGVPIEQFRDGVNTLNSIPAGGKIKHSLPWEFNVPLDDVIEGRRRIFFSYYVSFQDVFGYDRVTDLVLYQAEVLPNGEFHIRLTKAWLEKKTSK